MSREEVPRTKCPAAALSRVAFTGRYAFGECYFECTKDQADELLDSQKEDMEAEIKGVGEEIDKIKETLQSLKDQLYSRFGNNINLEEN